MEATLLKEGEIKGKPLVLNLVFLSEAGFVKL